ncbi:NACHT, LRR and PYD domains-containing protein 12-like, partial [Esox lucius]|uniref:NACHT, LRR and PYD domains-containing protein 12-like n=1 Tax=Esox lucius TaxID=8010 RepID=UPI001477249E
MHHKVTTASKISLCGKNELNTGAVGVHQGRPDSPVPSCLSMKSDRSMGPPIHFRKGDSSQPWCVSMESEKSMNQSINFREGEISTELWVHQERPDSPVPSCLSMKSDWSMDHPNSFRKEDISTELRMDNVGDFRVKSAPKESQTLQRIQQDIKTKLKQRYEILFEGIGLHENQTLLNNIYTDLYITEGESGEVNKQHEVRQIEMASKRQTTSETPITCNDIFKPRQQHEMQYWSPALLIRKTTSISLNHENMFSDRTRSSQEHESKSPLVHLHGHDKHIKKKGLRNLTKGIAGIGKTVSVQKVILDWAEGKVNQEIDFIFPIPFRDLNMKKDQCSLMQLLTHYFPELKEIDRIENGLTKTVFIFDGLDECRLPLDFKNNKKCCDVTEPTSVDVLLTNLIEGNLLPSALLWITTRPAAANRIPPECVDQVSEIRGFNEQQKEEYFRKKIADQNLANEIINHIKTSRSLHIMCHIPVFCWISATVLELMLKEAEEDEIPKTLTQMYEHFLLIQTSMKNKKYNKSIETNPKELSQSDKDMILKLSKLAFQQLQKGNLVFYEKDLRECGIDVSEASEYSALCTEIFKEESGLYQEKVFSFVHLSIQEFLAAVHALESCLGKEEEVCPRTVITKSPFQHDDGDGLVRHSLFHHYDENDEVRNSDKLSVLYSSAVDKALKSENGHLDLFLRFLLGLSLESNQNLLQGLLTRTGSTTQNNEETVKRTVEYLSQMIKMESSPERIINLFHCLTEIGANSLVEEMQTSLQSGTLSETELEPHQCSALAYLLLMSEEVLEEFDMKTYKTSEEGHRRLLPVVKTCKRAILSGCRITEEGCVSLVSVLKSNPSHLKELDLSYNHPEIYGVNKLSDLLKDPQCRLQTLRLSHCGITEEGCASLVSALKLNPSHLKELDLSNNNLKDKGVEKLSALLKKPQCKLEILRLSGCLVTEEGCASLVSALKSNPSHLKKIDLSNNDLRDTGVKCLSAILEDPQCRLETLRLSGCLVTEEGCGSLVSALKTNPSHLKEINLTYNHPGDLGVRLLSAGLEDPHWRLEELHVDHGGE